ncbi:diguanylate cyclase (GGDEF) domain-containing protein [Caloramator fervidus]|uniref:Diguanylate cyclase (GGDEF) domain-containing protein n=1 Tax=Caloramator fervidus TaxID=29344 RepID=A0A1H5WW26_9CLOT|nr:EAL domain-containing protein [Caloramator fervidus]SEG03674.1 diguanylate cyclase (GGDEF) domain-containing protein [Caloramator fervidus]
MLPNKDFKGKEYYDYLTGLPNRYYLYDYYRCKNCHLTVAFLDFDNFKYINDSYGHSFGDDVLIKISDILVKMVKNRGKVFRFGGDEFIILFDCKKDEAFKIIENIIERFNYCFKVGNREVLTTVSVGVYISSAGENIDDIIRKADMSMFEAKKLGKSNYVVFNKEMEDTMLKKANMMVDIKRALLEEEFYILYQPIYDLKEGKIKEVEALARWKSEKYGDVPPSVFVPILEETGLIREFGIFVIEGVFNDIKRWMEEDINIKVNINVSPLQLRDDAFFLLFDNLLSKYKVPSSLIGIEFTETQILNIQEQKINKINEFLKRGMKISLDDFGVGYSSLINMINFPISTIKIDKSLIDRIDDKNGSALIKGILYISKEMNYEVVAEGVETKEQVEILKRWGCNKIQGYYISGPKTFEEIKEFIGKKGGWK